MSSRRTRVPLRVTEVIDYAVKATVLLGAHEGEYLSSVEIAEHFGMSSKMLGQVLRSLGAAGILVARQGWHGGFSLARPARTIPLRAVIAAVGSGEPSPPSPPSSDGFPHIGNGAGPPTDVPSTAGAVEEFWRALDTQVQAILEERTIADLVAGVGAPVRLG